MLIPIKTKHRPEATPWATYTLMALNVAAFLLTSNGFVVYEHMVQAYALKSNHFHPLNLLTSMFMHGDVFHLLGNMLFLWVFGPAVEGRLRTFGFSTMYAASGIAGSLLHHWVVGLQEPNIPSLGASGAIMGVLASALFMFPHGRVVMFIWFFRPILFEWPVWTVALYYLGGDVVAGFFASGTGIAHFAHIGGAMGGFGVTWFYGPQRDNKAVAQAQAMAVDTRGIEDLGSEELKALSKAKPDDPSLALQLVTHKLKSEAKLSEAEVREFVRLVPKMLDECDCVVVAETVRHLAISHPSLVPSSHMVEVGLRVERVADPGLATSLYASALSRKDLDARHNRLALLHMGIVQQDRLGNPNAAATFYRHAASGDDWCPLQDQALERLRALGEAA
jgi:membrane associated rhomboid family serine protease